MALTAAKNQNHMEKSFESLRTCTEIEFWIKAFPYMHTNNQMYCSINWLSTNNQISDVTNVIIVFPNCVGRLPNIKDKRSRKTFQQGHSQTIWVASLDEKQTFCAVWCRVTSGIISLRVYFLYFLLVPESPGFFDKTVLLYRIDFGLYM